MDIYVNNTETTLPKIQEEDIKYLATHLKRFCDYYNKHIYLNTDEVRHNVSYLNNVADKLLLHHYEILCPTELIEFENNVWV